MMIFIFVVYLVVVIGLALWYAVKSKSKADFILGDRKFSGIALALSERATGESAWLLLGLSGEAYLIGVKSIWVAIGCVLGILFIWIVMSGRLREEADKSGALTISSLLSRKFPGAEKSIGMLSALILIFFFLFYIAAQFKGAGTVFEKTFGISPLWGMVIGSLVVVLYTSFGGFMAVVATDVFQAMLMIFTLIVLPVLVLFAIAAHDINFTASLAAVEPGFGSMTNTLAGGTAGLFIINGLCWAFGYSGQPQLLSRMMALRSQRDVKRGIWVAVIWTMLAYTGAILIGLGGRVLVQSGQLPGITSHLADAEQILPALALVLINPLLAGILLSGVVSAMMSTASSELIISSSAMSEDIYHHCTLKKKSDRQMVRLNKILTLGVGLLAFAIVFLMPDTIFRLVSYAWAGIGSAFGPALILTLFWKKFSRAGVFASLITGSLGAILWKEFIFPTWQISEIFGSFVLSFSMAVLCSLLFPEKRIHPAND